MAPRAPTGGGAAADDAPDHWRHRRGNPAGSLAHLGFMTVYLRVLRGPSHVSNATISTAIGEISRPESLGIS